VKRSNSVFNNFSENRFSSSAKKKFSSRNGFLDTQTEFASDFYNQNKVDSQNHEVRERNSMRNKQTNPSSRKKNTG
jgi:hypothetical protein